MKTFEEKWTAWIDDQLTGRELDDFLASLPDRAAAEGEKQEAKQLGTLLREQAVSLSNADFFSHQLRQRIEKDDQEQDHEQEQESSGWWTIRRLLWGAAVSFAVFLACAVFVFQNKTPQSQSQYLTEILSYRVDPNVSPNASITTFEKKDDHVTVLWADGLQSFPKEYAAK
ncbi:MAG: hypothetical protein JO354_03660 [Verrucomicrobia bacterium]|nr:hypothetical protein [Verrucomicrobiota bacterium]